MNSAIHFVHLTDLHISSAGVGLQTDTLKTLEEVIGMLRALKPQPSFVVVSGDLTEHGDRKSYGLVHRMLQGSGVPLVYALGNHDNRLNFYHEILGRTEASDSPYCDDRAVAGVHAIVLDSSVPGRIGGSITEDQFEFLHRALLRHADLPKLLVIHHPPSLDEEQEYVWDCIDFASSMRLAEALKGRNVAGILSGHTHYDRVIHWFGVPVIVGTGHYNATDISYPHGQRVVEGAGFTLCTLRPSGLDAGFVPLARSRAELAVNPTEKMRSLDRELQ